MLQSLLPTQEVLQLYFLKHNAILGVHVNCAPGSQIPRDAPVKTLYVPHEPSSARQETQLVLLFVLQVFVSQL